VYMNRHAKTGSKSEEDAPLHSSPFTTDLKFVQNNSDQKPLFTVLNTRLILSHIFILSSTN
jgi:hypothetical protein